MFKATEMQMCVSRLMMPAVQSRCKQLWPPTSASQRLARKRALEVARAGKMPTSAHAV
jgi:hypothetical protein